MDESCRRCSQPLDAEHRYCPHCGTPRDLADADAAQRQVEERIELLCRYLPDALVRHLLVERQAPVGQNAVAAVVFADISGFTSMSERMEPEQVLAIMNGCFEGLVDTVEKHGGVVDKFIGDCLMAVFGVPAAHGDDATRAVRACMEMFTFLEEYNKSLAKPLGLSVGVNYGPLVSGNLGSKTRMDYTVLGNTVNLSQRLEAAATAGQVLVSESVQRAAQRDIAFEKLAPIRVKGISKAVQVYQAVREQVQASQAQSIGLIGRDQQLQALGKALRQASLPALVLDLHGDEGAGKTRLIEEVAARWNQQSATSTPAVIASAPNTDQQRPYGSIGALVRAVCGIEVNDSPTRLLQKLDRLRDLGLESGWQLFLKHAAAAESSEVGKLDSQGIQQGMLASCRALFSALAKSRTLLFIDAVERFDDHSRKIFAKLWSAGPPDSLRLVTVRRSRTAALFPSAAWFRSATIKALDADASVALACARLQIDRLPPAAAEFLAEQAAGNPRYILELVASLEEAGYIYQSQGRTMVREDLGTAAGGLELASMVRSRIDALPIDQKHLLQAGALYGSTFPADIVSQAANEVRRGPQWLKGMAERGLLTAVGNHFSFAHELLHQSAMESLLTGQRSSMFGHLGAALEAHPEGKHKNQLPRLADFFSQSDDRQKAIFYLERAGNFLLPSGEFERAAKYLQLLADLLQGDEALATTATRTGIQAGRAYELGGNPTLAYQCFQNALTTAGQAKSSQLSAESQRHVARLNRQSGKLTDATRLIHQALGFARQSQDQRCQAWALLEAAEIDLAGKQDASAKTHLEEAQELSASLRGEDPEGSVRGRSLGRLGRLALTENNPELAQSLMAEAASVCESADDQGELVRLYGNLGVLCHRFKKEGAQTFFERAITLSRTIGDKLGEAKQLHNLGSFLLSTGDRDSARSQFFASRDLAQALEWMEGVAVNANAIQQLGSQELRDTETGLFNRAYLDQRLGAELARAARSQQVVSLMLIKIAEPSATGQLLTSAANFLRPPFVRTCDVGARIETSTLALILPDTAHEGALIAAGRIREQVKDLHEGSEGEASSIKFGLATSGPDIPDAQKLLQAALDNLGDLSQ